ncbi:MAG: sulfatase-like hydrolase/transferase [Rikenellaceae bacterium]
MKRELTTTLYLLGGVITAHAQQNNILVIVVDDLGKEILSIYDTQTIQKANTPNINKLAQRGIVFDQVWGYPLSAPVRAAMLTGRHGHNTGILALNISLPLSEQTLFEALPDGYSNALFGKWHLSDYEDFAPDYGIDLFAGIASGGGVRNYNEWRFTKNGESSLINEYSTTKITDEATAWIETQDEPWFCWVAYNAPHTPLHLPSGEMHTHKELSGDAKDIEQNPLPYFLAMVESLDYEIGRLLDSVDSSTTIILIGDNGTEKSLLQAPYSSRHGKGSLYESGVAIPLIVYSPLSQRDGKRSDALVSAPDIFPTVMEIAGVEMQQYEDGYSFASIMHGGESEREFNFSEILNQHQGYMNAISDGRYKLITTKNGQQELYDTQKDPTEQNNLLQGSLNKRSSSALETLQAALEQISIDMDKIPERAPSSSKRNNKRRFRYRSSLEE